jgi:hypothetical protein
MNTVYNLNTGDEITYDDMLSAEESVIIAYMQFVMKDYNTWNYKTKIEKFKNQLCYWKYNVTMGDYCTKINKENM